MALRRDFVSQTTSNQHGFDAPDDTFIVIRVSAFYNEKKRTYEFSDFGCTNA